MRRRRLAAAGGLGLLVLAAVGWTLGWRWAAGQTTQTLDDWMAREARVGRRWSCPGRTVSGFPTDIVVACANAGFAGEIAGRQFAGRLGGFRAAASVLHPRTLRTTLTSPFALTETAGGGRLDLTWTRLAIDLVGLPERVASATLDGADVALAGAVPGWGPLAGGAAQVDVAVAARGARTYGLDLRIAGGRVPPLDALLGGAAPATASLAGTVSAVDLDAEGDAATRLELWRRDGGRLQIDSLRIAHGDASVGGSGTFALDGAHRPEGRLDARFAGLEPVLRRFGVDPGLVAATGLLGSLLGGGRNAGRADDGGGLRLPIVLAGGRLAIGPIRTSIPVPPLY